MIGGNEKDELDQNPEEFVRTKPRRWTMHGMSEQELAVLESIPLLGGQDANTYKYDPSELESKLTFPLMFAVMVCALGSSFQIGYNLGVVNTPEKVVRQWFRTMHNETYHEPQDEAQNTVWWSIAVSSFALGGMFGGLGCGYVADKFGRKGGMFVSNCTGFLAAALMGMAKYANSYPMFVMGRLIVGMNCGLNSGLAPLYLTEIAPVNYRGALGTVYQLTVNIGILVSQILGIFLGTETMWPLLFALTALPEFFQSLFLKFCPESPRYTLIYKKQEERTEDALKKLRGKDDVTMEMKVLRRAAAEHRNMPEVKFMDLFRYPLAWPLSIGVMMMLSLQFSGINACTFFSSNIFQSAGLDGNKAQIATLAMGALTVSMTFVSLMLIDRFGRRILHISGLVIMFVMSAGITISITVQKAGVDWAGYLSVVCVLLFTIGFATGPGSIPWFFCGEIFQQGARGHASAIAITFNWLANFAIGLLFLPLQQLIGQYSFLVFSGCLLFFIIYAFFFMPETKGHPIEYIVRRFEDEEYFCHKET